MPTVNLTEAMDTWENLVKVGLLEFRILANAQDHPELVDTAQKLAQLGERSAKIEDADGELMGKWVSLARVFNDDLGVIEKDAPFKYVPRGGALVRNGSTGELLNLNRLQLSAKPDVEKVQLANWAKQEGIRDLQVLVVQPEKRMDVQGRGSFQKSNGKWMKVVATALDSP